MKFAQWFHPPRVVLTLFISLMTVCALALGWLGWKVLVQDRAVEAQQQQQQLESALDRAVTAIERAFSASDAEVTVTAAGDVEMTPPGRLAFAPTEATPNAIQEKAFSQAEALEYGSHDQIKASEAYKRLAESSNGRMRAEALVGLGRTLRRQQKWMEALQTYDSLQKLDGTIVAGMPASLVGRDARRSILADSGDRAGASREASALWSDLIAGKWKVGKGTLETYFNELKAAEPELATPGDWEERMVMAEAAQRAFEQTAEYGRAVYSIEGLVVSASWERRGGSWKARLIGPPFWQALWTQLEHDNSILLHVVDAEGNVIHGGATSGITSSLAATVSGLPWNISANAVTDNAMTGYWNERRRFLIAGLGIFAAVLGLGSFLIARAMNREFAVARLQSDFVSAVSHEFRTPLTSIRQLTEMLARGRMETERDKQQAYELMLGQSDRLRRLVESLLDFGRMQARQFKYRSEDLEAIEWFRAVANEFQETVRSRGYDIEFTAPDQAAWILGDREALAGALWNFLDNAVKYSPDGKRVEIAVSRANGNVEVSVRDHGSGITKEDLKRVFGKFYRGANAKTQGTPGTGIGLAIVKEIVEAHRGTVHVRSKPGEGSEFTMVLPCRES